MAALAVGLCAALFLYSYIVLIAVLVHGHSLLLVLQWPAGIFSQRFCDNFGYRCDHSTDARHGCRRVITTAWVFVPILEAA